MSQESRRLRRLDLLNEDGKTVARVDVDEPGSPTVGPSQLTVRTLRGYEDQAQRARSPLEGSRTAAAETLC